MDKARVVIYDDLLIIDETEINFTDSKNLEAIVASCLRSTPDAEIAEVYVKGKMKSRMQLTPKGKIKKLSIHPNWGGRREGAGRKKQIGTRTNIIAVRVDDETWDYLCSLLDKKAEFVRAAIKEKRERDNK